MWFQDFIRFMITVSQVILLLHVIIKFLIYSSISSLANKFWNLSCTTSVIFSGYVEHFLRFVVEDAFAPDFILSSFMITMYSGIP